jgi:hypothetical protein
MQHQLLDVDLESDLTVEEIQSSLSLSPSFCPTPIVCLTITIVLSLCGIFLWFFMTHF